MPAPRARQLRAGPVRCPALKLHARSGGETLTPHWGRDVGHGGTESRVRDDSGPVIPPKAVPSWKPTGSTPLPRVCVDDSRPPLVMHRRGFACPCVLRSGRRRLRADADEHSRVATRTATRPHGSRPGRWPSPLSLPFEMHDCPLEESNLHQPVKSRLLCR